MSYAGTYGPDETCMHDCYYKSCQWCCNIGPRATQEQIDAQINKRINEIKAAQDERDRRNSERHVRIWREVTDGYGRTIERVELPNTLFTNNPETFIVDL